jgi:cytochrome c biogenesis protein CcmG/thiol:disulfide interchange protein DsbE
MNRFLLPVGLFGALVVVLAIGIGRAPQKSVIPSALLGKPAPQFVLPQLGVGGQFDSRSLRGRWYLLNVWGTWCAECRAEHDTLLAIQREGRVPIIGLNWKDEDGLAVQWLQELGNPYASIALDREGRVAIDWGVYGAPETFLVDAAGTVVYKHVGPLTAQVWQREFLARLPPAAAGPARDDAIGPPGAVGALPGGGRAAGPGPAAGPS